MSNDNNELKNNAPCEEKQEARELTEAELAQVTGGVAHSFEYGVAHCINLSVALDISKVGGQQALNERPALEKSGIGNQILKEDHDMSKTKEELDTLKEEVESVNEKLQELTEEEIAQVNGGKPFVPPPVPVEQ